jgi:hypothetical protein
VRISAGSEEAAGTISFVPDLRPMVAAGLLEGIVNLRNKSVITPVRRSDGFEQEIESWSRDFNGGKASAAARAAFYLKGTIRGDLLLTAAYDSDKETRARLLRDMRPDELYPVYGDASLRSFDARSASRLYVRVDKARATRCTATSSPATASRRSSAGCGGIAEAAQPGQLQPHRHRRAPAPRASAGGNVFAFRDTLRQVVKEFASQGSGPYGLRNNGVLEGSEKVEVIVRDRSSRRASSACGPWCGWSTTPSSPSRAASC